MDIGEEKCWFDCFSEIPFYLSSFSFRDYETQQQRLRQVGTTVLEHLVQGDGRATIPESVREATGHGT